MPWDFYETFSRFPIFYYLGHFKIDSSISFITIRTFDQFIFSQCYNFTCILITNGCPLFFFTKMF